MTVARHAPAGRGAAPAPSSTPTTGVVEALRAVKDADEIAADAARGGR